MGPGEIEWFSLARERQAVNSCEHSNEPLDSIKCGKFFD